MHYIVLYVLNNTYNEFYNCMFNLNRSRYLLMEYTVSATLGYPLHCKQAQVENSLSHFYAYYSKENINMFQTHQRSSTFTTKLFLSYIMHNISLLN